MRILISGGCKMGKSTLAQRLAIAQGGKPFYIATMRPHDEEDRRRVKRHRDHRAGWGFETVECSGQIERLAGMLPADASLLLDSTTALLAEEMFGQDGTMDANAAARVRDGILKLGDAYGRIVAVSDAIYSDALAYEEGTETYRRGLAMVDRAMAQVWDAVIEMTFTRPIVHKGSEALKAWLGEDAPKPQGFETIAKLNESGMD